MMWEIVEPIFLRYALTILVLSMFVMMLIALDVCSINADAPTRGWSNTVYVCIQFVCAIALLITTDALVRRVPAQTLLMRRVLLESFDDADFAAIRFWDNVQRTYECCGPNNASDWSHYPMPRSCCKDGQSSSAPVQTTQIGAVADGGAEGARRVVPLVFGNKFYFFYDSEMCPSPTQVHANGCIQTLTLVVRSAAKWLTVCAFVFSCLAVVAGFVACARNLGPIRDWRVGRAGRGDGPGESDTDPVPTSSSGEQEPAATEAGTEATATTPSAPSEPATAAERRHAGDRMESLA